MRQAGATLHRGVRASHYRGHSRCRAQAPDAQAQQLWLMGLLAPRHVGSSQTRARTHVPCISRQILNHCATREALAHEIFVAAHGVFHCGVRAPERVGSVVEAYRLSSCGAPALEHAGSVVVVCGLSCPTACGILVP